MTVTTDRRVTRRNGMTIRLAAFALLLAMVLGILLTPGMAAAADPLPAWSARQTDGGAVRVAISAPKDPRFAHLAWPKVVRAPDGTIVVACLAGEYHGGTGCPAVSLSTDGGKTFSAPNVLREFGPGKDYHNSGNLAVAVASDGAIALLAMAHTGDKTNTIFGWRSTDNGKTWQQVDTPTLGPNKTGSVTSMIDVPGAGLLATGHYRAGSKPHVQGTWVAVSKDSGKTWGEPRVINNVAGGEPVIVRAERASPAGSDRLLVFIRSRTVPQARQYLAVSDDLGKTWETSETNIGVEKKGTLAHPFAMVNPANPEELVLLTAERPLPGQVWLWRGDPKTLMFKRDRVVLTFPKIAGDGNTDYGYTWLLPIDQKRGLMFYYHGQPRGASHIFVADVAF